MASRAVCPYAWIPICHSYLSLGALHAVRAESDIPGSLCSIRLFGGRLPPTHTPKAGGPLAKLVVPSAPRGNGRVWGPQPHAPYYATDYLQHKAFRHGRLKSMVLWGVEGGPLALVLVVLSGTPHLFCYVLIQL